MNSPKHTVRFCFNYHKNEYDHAYITRDTHDTYAFAGLWNNQDGKVFRKNYTMNGAEVRRWLRATLNLMSVDDIPCLSLQMDFPTMPIIVINQNNLSKNMDCIMEALDFFLDGPPINGD